MRLLRKLTNKEWEEIGEKYKDGGVHNYRGKMTLFWNGEELRDDNGEYLVYHEEQRQTWEVIIVLPGVEIIPPGTFFHCEKLKTVIMADSVNRIEGWAFDWCESLEFVRLSRNVEHIGEWAFRHCDSLTSIFIPPSCREIGNGAFWDCIKLIILSVPRHTDLGDRVISNTALIKTSPFETDGSGTYDYDVNNEANEWVKRINGDTDEYALHRACASSNPPLDNDILLIMQRQGLVELRKRNLIGVTPLQYLEANPYADIDEQEILNKYIIELLRGVV